MGNQCLKDASAATKKDDQPVQSKEPEQMAMEGQVSMEPPWKAKCQWKNQEKIYATLYKGIHGLMPFSAEPSSAQAGSTSGDPTV